MKFPIQKIFRKGHHFELGKSSKPLTVIFNNQTMYTLKRSLQFLPSVFQKNEITSEPERFDYNTPTTKFMLVSCKNPEFVTLIEECLNSDTTKRPTFEEIQSKLRTIARVDTLYSSARSDLDKNSPIEYQYGLDQNKIDQFNEYINTITTIALNDKKQSQKTIQKFNEQIQKAIERLKKPKGASFGSNYMRLCKVFNETELRSSGYLQTTLFREAINLSQLHHPAIVSFAGFDMYNTKILFDSNESAGNSSDYMSDDEAEGTEEKGEKAKVEEEAVPMIQTSPTIFLEPVRQYPNLDNLINSGCKLKFGPNQIPWNSTKAYIFILGLTHAVSYLHRNGIIHRNLIPDVIYFDEDFYPKLIDFSTSRQISAKKGSKEETDVSMTIRNCNTPAYEAYEILDQSNENYDSSIDVFSLGRLIYAILAKCHPFKHGGDANKYPTSSLTTRLPQTFDLPSFEGIPEPYQELLTKCWDPNPSKRYLASQIYEILKRKDENYNIIYPNDETDMEEVNQYIQRLEASETTLPICICYEKDAEYNIHIPGQPISLDVNLSEINVNQLVNLLENCISNQFIDIGHYERPLHLFQALISQKNINCTKIVGAFFNSEYFSKFLHSNHITATKIIDQFFGEENDSQINPKEYTTHLRFPSTTERIEAESFSGLPECQFIYIPESVKEIGDRAFANCPKLQFVFIPRYGELSKIGEGAFANCTSLSSFSFPDKVKIVSPHTFENDGELTDIDFNKIENIEPYAFANCLKISKLEFPPTLKSIKEYAFKKLPTRMIHFPKKFNDNSTPNIARTAFPLFAFFGH